MGRYSDVSDTSLCRRVDSNYTIGKIAHNSVFMFGCRLHCSRLRTKESARDVTSAPDVLYYFTVGVGDDEDVQRIVSYTYPANCWHTSNGWSVGGTELNWTAIAANAAIYITVETFDFCCFQVVFDKL